MAEATTTKTTSSDKGEETSGVSENKGPGPGASTAATTAATSSVGMEELSFRLKPIRLGKREFPIILQNENGPCPLLAISNILLLTGQIFIHPDYPRITTTDLISLIAQHITSLKIPENVQKDKEMLASYQRNCADALSMLPQLAVGLDVNVRFRGIRDFEFTRECLIFDLLNINLVHGWLPDPQNVETTEVLSQLSYNQMLEKLVGYNTLMGVEPSSSSSTPQTRKKTANSKEENEEVEGTEKGEESEEEKETEKDATQTTTESKITTTALPDFDKLTPEQRETLRQGAIVQRFLAETPSQLTYHGLVELHQGINERELCVFFRNNHFSTLTKRKGELYLLATDLGYLDSSIVWEKLNQIDGDAVFMTATFRPVKPVIADDSVFSADALLASSVASADTEDDYQLAFKLQQREIRQQERREEALRESRERPRNSKSSKKGNGKQQRPPSPRHKDKDKDGCLLC